MRAIANGSATSDPTCTVIEAVQTALADLDGYSVADMTDDTELAELIGRLRSLVGVLVAVTNR